MATGASRHSLRLLDSRRTPPVRRRCRCRRGRCRCAGAGARIVARYPFVRRDAVAGARGGIADLGGAEVRVLHAGHGLTGAAALRLHAVVHGTRIVVVADRAADRGIGAASDDVAVREVQLNIGCLRHLDRLRLCTRRHVAEPLFRPLGPALSNVAEGPSKRRAGSEVRRTLTYSTMCSGGFTQRGCCAPPARLLDTSTQAVHVPDMTEGARSRGILAVGGNKECGALRRFG